MSKKVDFYFDFASPNAYLSHKVIQSIKERTGAEITYIPVLLGGIFKLTNNKPPMEQFFGVKNKNEYQNLEMERFIARHGLDKFQMNPHFPVISLQIIRGAVAANMVSVPVLKSLATHRQRTLGLSSSPLLVSTQRVLIGCFPVLAKHSL